MHLEMVNVLIINLRIRLTCVYLQVVILLVTLGVAQVLIKLQIYFPFCCGLKITNYIY